MSSAAAAPRALHLERLAALRQAVGSVLEGKSEVVDLALVALLARGHALIEDVPGVGKTTLARGLARALGCQMHRVQFTSDLLPSDLLGVSVFDQARAEFVLRRGPLFANILLADEINRASPRTQSALLEAMSEGQVSIDGQTLPLPEPFLVIATQNPQDFAGTFPLPESQLDRFMVRTHVGYPPADVETRLMLHPEVDRVAELAPVLEPASFRELQAAVDAVRIDVTLGAYLHAVVSATRSHALLALGASTRAGMSLGRAARARALLLGRSYVVATDIHDLAVPVLSHRVRLAAQATGVQTSREESEHVLRQVLARVSVPL